MIIMPSSVQATAITLSIAFPLMIFCYRRGDPGHRFRAVSLATVVLFAVAAIYFRASIADVISGSLLLSAALIFWWGLWSVLSFGFTITMLTSLATAEQPVSIKEWADKYTKGSGLSVFAHNRLYILVSAGLAKQDCEFFSVTPSGASVASAARLLRLFFGI